MCHLLIDSLDGIDRSWWVKTTRNLDGNTHCIMPAANRSSSLTSKCSGRTFHTTLNEKRRYRVWTVSLMTFHCKGGEIKKKNPPHHSVTLCQFTDCKASQLQGLYHFISKVHSTSEPGGVQAPTLQKCFLCWPWRCSLPPVLPLLLLYNKRWIRERTLAHNSE